MIKSLSLADVYACSELLDVATTFTKEQFPEVVKEKEFLNLSIDEVCDLIRSNQVNIFFPTQK